mmetsp:Transcript_124128/g.356522  ORF Transcript_124128/g.356522 Transcript_124128/m.356522 type:complete len:223 (-) Transcript_124128:90-758(-)
MHTSHLGDNPNGRVTNGGNSGGKRARRPGSEVLPHVSVAQAVQHEAGAGRARGQPPDHHCGPAQTVGVHLFGHTPHDARDDQGGGGGDRQSAAPAHAAKIHNGRSEQFPGDDEDIREADAQRWRRDEDVDGPTQTRQKREFARQACRAKLPGRDERQDEASHEVRNAGGENRTSMDNRQLLCTQETDTGGRPLRQGQEGQNGHEGGTALKSCHGRDSRAYRD